MSLNNKLERLGLSHLKDKPEELDKVLNSIIAKHEKRIQEGKGKDFRKK